MLEVEVKFAVADFDLIRNKLREWNAPLEPPRRDEDRYFNAPDRDFAATDEALRIRSIGESNVVTYKGPKIDRETKSRTEIEVGLAAGAEAAADFGRVLLQLRYRPVAVVRKSRQIARYRRDGFDVQVSLDDVDGVGRFAEVEAMADESRWADAKKVVLAAAGELGMTTSERRSYLQMLLERSPVG